MKKIILMITSVIIVALIGIKAILVTLCFLKRNEGKKAVNIEIIVQG